MYFLAYASYSRCAAFLFVFCDLIKYSETCLKRNLGITEICL